MRPSGESPGETCKSVVCFGFSVNLEITLLRYESLRWKCVREMDERNSGLSGTEKAANIQSEEKYKISSCSDPRRVEQSAENAQDIENESECVIYNVTSVFTQIGRRNEINLHRKGPVLHLTKGFESPVHLGRSRSDFPDPNKDYAVHVLAFKSPDTTETIDEDFCRECRRKRYGNYDIEVNVETGNDGETPDCLWKRYKNTSKKTYPGGFAGYWFRFFEPNTEYKITFALKGVKLGKRQKRETLHEITVTVFTDSSRSKATKSKSKDSRSFDVSTSDDEGCKSIVPFNFPQAAPSEQSLELSEISNDVMKQLQHPRDNGRWREFEEVSCRLSVKFPDIDTQVTILLEKSIAKCYLNQIEESKVLIKKALSQAPEAWNSGILIARAYHYLAGVYRREKNLGEAERCVELAAQNLHGGAASLDKSFLAYEQASILLDFCSCCPSASPKLLNMAKNHLKQCIAVCTQIEEMSDSGGQQLYVKKHHFALIKMAMLLLDCRTKVGRERAVSEGNIKTAQDCLDTLESKYWNGIAQGERVQFYLARSDLKYRQQDFLEAERFAREALKISKLFSFNTEIRPAQERLEHIRQKIQQFRTPEGSGDEWDSAFSDLSVTSSASDGQCADISSGNESDWLPSG